MTYTLAENRKTVALSLSDYRCPACDATDQWKQVAVRRWPGGDQAAVIAFCDCGKGELRIEVA